MASTAAAYGEGRRGTRLPPIARGLIWAALGYALGVLIVAGVRVATGAPPWSLEPLVVGGYPLGLAGWLLGVGVWEYWAVEWLGRTPSGVRDTTWRRYFWFTMDHKVIGVQYLVTFVTILLIAGVLAMVMRLELMRPGTDFLDAKAYNQVMSMHGLLMISVAVAAVIGGFGNYFVPLMIGAEDMAFPRLNALSYWLVPPIPLLLLGTTIIGGWDTGWTGYPPLSETNGHGQILYNLAFFTLGLSSILGGLNFIVTVVTMRAPGMSWGRLPIFVWSIFLTSILSVLFTQSVASAMLLVLLDRVFGFVFFDPEGGSVLLYQHIFWFYSHPAVYIMMLPGLGLMLEIIAHFSRRPLFAYRWVVGALMAIVVLSSMVWAHHMFAAGIPSSLHPFFLATTELISIPTGLIFLSALGTVWAGRMWLRTPMLFALAVVFNFLIGGITGVFLADVPTDLHLNNTYFVVAHFHYVIVGGEIFAFFAGIYYWFPKVAGRQLSETLGRIHFWLMFVGFNAAFLPMFWAGIHGMNRRIATYVPDLEGVNMAISLAAFLLGSSFIFFVINVVRSWTRGPRAAANPWRALTLEWQTSSPPPLENFLTLPTVVAGPYAYGTGGAHAVLEPGGTGTE